MAQLASMRTRDRLRSKETEEYVFVEPNGKIKRANFFVGLGTGDGERTYWTKQGWRIAKEFDAEQKSKKAEAEATKKGK